jgi:uncharacterized protein YuzE
MAVYTYDTDSDVLYVLLVEESEAAIDRTEELGPDLHVDLDVDGRVIGVEFMYPRDHGPDPHPVNERFGIDLRIPFSFAA